MAGSLHSPLDLMVLHILSLGPAHGWGISERIQQRSEDALRLGQGSLYPALQRLERKGWVEAEWGTSSNNRRARFYRLTAGGRRALEKERATWKAFVRDVSLVLEPGA